jgi:hypothetical protein
VLFVRHDKLGPRFECVVSTWFCETGWHVLMVIELVVPEIRVDVSMMLFKYVLFMHVCVSLTWKQHLMSLTRSFCSQFGFEESRCCFRLWLERAMVSPVAVTAL